MALLKFTQTLACAALCLSSALAKPSSCTPSDLSFFTTSDGDNYAYSYTPAKGANSTFLFLHGYPSSHRDWQPQIDALTAQGFGTLVPDMLGFGASDMPTEPARYAAKRLAGHLAELLDHEELETVIGVGHDWGSGILSRMAVYHRERFEKFIWVNVGHQAPGGFIDLDAFNAMGVEAYGYMPYGYWYFMIRYEAASKIRNHLESYWHLVFPANNSVWQTHLAPLGAARAWLSADVETPDAPFISEEYKADWMSWISRPNATEAGLNCYRSQWGGVNDADEASLSDQDWMLRVPVLAIGGALDPVARAEFMEATRPYATAGFESTILQGGHWLSQELPDEVNKLMIDFARK